MNVSSAVGSGRRAHARPVIKAWRLVAWASVVVSVLAMVVVIAIFSTTNADAVAAGVAVPKLSHDVAFELQKKSETIELPAQ